MLVVGGVGDGGTNQLTPTPPIPIPPLLVYKLFALTRIDYDAKTVVGTK